MRNLVFLAFLAFLIFGVTGWFMDWYSFTSVSNGGGKTSVQFEIDRAKIGKDLSKGKDKLDKTIENLGATKPSQAPPSNDPWNWPSQGQGPVRPAGGIR